MSERRQKPRTTKDRRVVKFGRTPGKFADSVNAAFRVGRDKPLKPVAKQLEDAGISPVLKMTDTVARIKSELYVMNFPTKLHYAQFEFGDEVEIVVKLVSRPRCKHCGRTLVSHDANTFACFKYGVEKGSKFEKEESKNG